MEAQAMTKKQIEEIRARLEAATPGPWRKDATPGYFEPAVWIGEGCVYPEEQSDATFIAHAPQDIADLLEEVGRLRDFVAAHGLADDCGCEICGEARAILEEGE